MKEVPDGWLPNDPHRELANNLGVDLDREAAKFSAYAFKNGFSCPDKRFSSWLHDAAKYSQKTSGKDSSGYKFGSIE